MKKENVNSPKLGELISTVIYQHRMVGFLSEVAHMGHTTIAKLKRGN